MNGEPHKIKVYNLPQRVKGGIKIHGAKDTDGNDIVLLFHKMDGMYGQCTIEGSDDSIHLQGAVELIELGNDEYKLAEETKNES